MTKIEYLRQQISEANKNYWQLNKPAITDTQYDKLVEQLRKLSPNDPLLNYVGNESIPGAKVKHVEHMYSIGKCYTYPDVITWMSKVSRSENELIDCQIKLDGLSGELVNGRLITRGNGDVGTDISHLIPNMDIWMDLSQGIVTSIRSVVNDPVWRNRRIVGEILITEDRFKNLRQLRQGEDAYKSPRNMAAGFCNLKPEQSSQFKDGLGNPLKIATLVYHDAYSVTVPLSELRTNIDKIVANLLHYRYIKHLPCDGIVFKLHDREYAKSLGATSHHLNAHCAYKLREESEDVIVKSITWQVGERHVTPVANFDPVILDDVTINRATLHCKDFVVQNKVCVGSMIRIIRQGGVIPKVTEVLMTPTNARYTLPVVCPDCGEKLIEEGAYLSCKNDNCPSRISAKIVRGLNILGLKGVGPALARQTVGELYITNIMQWCTEMAEWKVDPIKWSEKYLKNQTAFTATQINTLMKVNDLMESGVKASTLLKSVCIEDVGDMFVNAINKYCGGVEKLMRVCPVDNMYTYLVDHHGVNSNSLVNFMVWMEQHHEEFLEYMKLFEILPEETQDDGIGSAEGTVALTGTGPKPRKELIEMAKKMGFVYTENINLANVLVCSDPNGNSSKLKKARAKGVLIRSYADFFNGHL